MPQNFPQRISLYRVFACALGLVAACGIFGLTANAQRVTWNIAVIIPTTGNTLTYSLACAPNPTGCPGGQSNPKEITMSLGDNVRWCANQTNAEIWIIHQDDILDDDNGHPTHLHHGNHCVGGATDKATTNSSKKHEYYVVVYYSGKVYVGVGDPRIIVGGGPAIDAQIDKIKGQIRELHVPSEDNDKVKTILDELDTLKNELKTP